MNYIYLFIILAITTVCGCSTRNDTLVDSFDDDNQTPDITLKGFKDAEKRNDVQDANKTVIATISGGGHRAGNFGVGVLMALEKIECNSKSYNALNEIDYFSTVSGGGFAAGAYISSLYDHDTNKKYSFYKKINNDVNEIKRNLERGYHNDLIGAFTQVKSIGSYDRGDYLEQEFDEKILGAAYRNNNKSITFGDMFIESSSAEEAKLPVWIANATIYENGSIFPFYPGSFEKYNITSYVHNVEEVNKNINYSQIPLSLGLKASATFPVAMPATTLGSGYDQDNGFIHLFDGGLADNLGISTAIRLLESSNKKTKVLIVIDAFNGNSEPFSKNKGSPLAAQIYNRATSISLDTWHIRHKWITERLINGIQNDGENISVIYLTFDQAKDDTKKEVGDIGTNFNIDSDEQKALFRAASQAVYKNTEIIIKALFGDTCSNN